MRIAICDDEKICRDIIIEYLLPYKELYPEIKIMEFDCGENLIKNYDNNKFDIIFLDIQMESLDGVETAKKIREKDSGAIIIFITSHIRFVPDTFRVGAFQFLMKPIKKEDFIEDFERAIEQNKINRFRYVIKWKDKTFTFEMSEIYYIEAYYRHLFVCNGENKFECVGKMSEIENKLKKYNFVRCHRNFLVNMNYIKTIGQLEIILKNNKSISLSKNMKINLMSTYNNYISGSAI